MENGNVPESTVVQDGNAGNLNDTQKVQSSEPKTPAWMSQLPDDLKGNENLAQYRTMGEAIKSLMGQVKEEPKEPEKVEYGDFENKINAEDDPFGDLQKGYTELFKSKNMVQADAEALIKGMNEINAKVKESLRTKGRELCEDIVKEKWGKDYQKNRALMAKGYQALDPEGVLQKELDMTGVSFSPALWELLRKAGSLVSEDTGSGSSSNVGTRASGVPVDYSKSST